MADVPFQLTTAAATRNIIGTTSTVLDTEINALIYVVSDQIARYCNRARGTSQYVEQKARTETLDVRRGQREFWLRAPPISSVSTVKYDEQQDFDNAEVVLTTDDYEFDAETGRLRVRYTLHQRPGPDRFLGALQVVYTGGIAGSIQALRSYAPALELACQLQLQAILKRQQIGGASVNIGGAGRSRSVPDLDLLPYVKTLLAPYRIGHGGRP